MNPSPSIEADWHRRPDGSAEDFLVFARGEGRFAPHFAEDGAPTPEICATRDERLANWRTLQELAGIRRAPAIDAAPERRKPLDFSETTPTMTAE